jgi:hypothetical protein
VPPVNIANDCVIGPFDGGGSIVTRAGVEAAAVAARGITRATLAPEATIYSAELHAIQIAIPHDTNKNYIIFSDSYSVLASFEEINYTHPIIRKLEHEKGLPKTAGR